jgi:class 3 adenylate cyclase/predicted esterase
VVYARTDDGIDVAYAVSGMGARDVVIVHGFATHLDLMWESPWHAAWASQLQEQFRIVHFDKRGTGLSDRSLGMGSIEQRSSDLISVMNAAGIERASLLGISEGAPMALVTAATHPDRVDRIATYGGYARLLVADDYPDGFDLEAAQQIIDWMVANWGTGEVFGGMFIESPASAIPSFGRFERNACTRQVMGRIMRANLEIDVRPLLPLVTAPTLVIHNDRDPVIPARFGRTVSDLVPGARHQEFPGEFHCTSHVEEAIPRIKSAIDFLAGPDRPERPLMSSRRLATVLFTDIVDSTKRAASVGDRAWREILEQHDRRAAAAVEASGGRLVKSTGDGILALFDGPSDAIACGRRLAGLVKPLDLGVRSGVHTGEVELRGGDVGGIGVHLAARVAAIADADELLVSRTVRDLMLGSDISFTPRGNHALKVNRPGSDGGSQSMEDESHGSTQEVPRRAA